jgi:hypothetical protein
MTGLAYDAPGGAGGTKKVLNCFGGAVVAQLLRANTAPVRMQPAAIRRFIR